MDTHLGGRVKINLKELGKKIIIESPPMCSCRYKQIDVLC